MPLSWFAPGFPSTGGTTGTGVNDCESEYRRERANGREGMKAALNGNDGGGEKPTVEAKGNEGVKVAVDTNQKRQRKR
jgi:hypothetical protein